MKPTKEEQIYAAKHNIRIWNSWIGRGLVKGKDLKETEELIRKEMEFLEATNQQ